MLCVYPSCIVCLYTSHELSQLLMLDRILQFISSILVVETFEYLFSPSFLGIQYIPQSFCHILLMRVVQIQWLYVRQLPNQQQLLNGLFVSCFNYFFLSVSNPFVSFLSLPLAMVHRDVRFFFLHFSLISFPLLACAKT